MNKQLFSDYVSRHCNSITARKRKDYTMSEKDRKYLYPIIAQQCTLNDQIVDTVNEILNIAENKSTPYYNNFVTKIRRKGLDLDLIAKVCGIDVLTLQCYVNTSPETCGPLLQQRIINAIDSFYGDDEIYIKYCALISRDNLPIDEMCDALGMECSVITGYVNNTPCPTLDVMRRIVDFLDGYVEKSASVTSVRNKVIATLHGYMISSDTLAHKLSISESEAQDILNGRTPCTPDLILKLQDVIKDCVDRTHTEFKPEKYFSYRVDNVSAIELSEMLTCKNPVQCENLLLKVLEDE